MVLSSFTRELASHLDPGSAWYLQEMALTSNDGPGRVCVGPVVSAFPQEGLEGEAWAPAPSTSSRSCCVLMKCLHVLPSGTKILLKTLPTGLAL